MVKGRIHYQKKTACADIWRREVDGVFLLLFPIDPTDVDIGIDITRGPVDVHGDLLGPLTWMLKVLAV